MDLKPDQHNANQGTERGRELLGQSIKELGAGRSILADKDLNVIAGNKTLEAAQKAGLKIRIVPTKRDELVVVQREDLDLTDPTGEARRLAYLDNRVGEIDLAWDAEVIAEDAQAGLELDTLGFLDKELQALLAGQGGGGGPEDPGAEIERAEELLIKWGVKAGQIWVLGVHRLMCGDSTNPRDVGQLCGTQRATICFTDPPWNVDYGGNLKGDNAQGYKVRKMNNDNLGEKFPAFVEAFVKMIWDFCSPGAVLYLVMGAQEWPVVDGSLRKKGFHWSSTIVWVKDQLVLSRKDYHTQFEPLWYGWRGDAARLREVMDRKQSDVWLIDRPKRSDEHPTMKPVELVERALNNSSLPGDVVLEPFSGSGTTLVACERLGRVCLAMDNDPKYVAVALERWSVMTGRTPAPLPSASPRIAAGERGDLGGEVP